MLKAHFIIMPFFRTDVAPLGIACLSSYLKKSGMDLSCTDFRLFKNDVVTFSYLGYQDNYVMDIPDLPLILALIKNYQQHKPLLADLDKTIEDYIRVRPLSFLKLRRDITDVYNIVESHLPKLLGYDLVFFSTYDTNFLFTIMCSLLLRQKRRDTVIVYGGPQVTQSHNASRLALKLGIADVVVMGEGEETLLKIIESHQSGGTLAVKGTMTYNDKQGSFVRLPAEPLDIETLPCPDFSILDLKGYAGGNLNLPLYASRGCPFKCNFCNEWKMWQPFRQLRPERVIKWMKELNRRHGAFRFRLSDSLLNASLPWLEDFADKLIKKKLDFQWSGYFRAKMDTELAKKLKRSGLCYAFIGIEALSQTLLDGMNKRRTVTENLEAIEAFRSCDIPLELSNVIGFPHESEQDFQKRWEGYLSLFKKYAGNIILSVEPFQLRPGSKIYEHFQDFGLSIKKWDQAIINMIPAVSDIVSQIYMSIKSSKPEPRQIIQRMNVMNNTFALDPDNNFKYQEKIKREFLKKSLNYLKGSKNIRIFFRDSHTIQTEKPKYFKKEFFLLYQRGKARCVINKKEKELFDKINGAISLSQTIEEMSKQTGKSRAKCVKEIIGLLENLLENGILFEIFFK